MISDGPSNLLYYNYMCVNVNFLNQFGGNCYHKITDDSVILILLLKDIDAVNLSNILNHKEVTSHVPDYVQNRMVSIQRRRCFINRPIKNTDCLWRPCLLNGLECNE